MILYNLAIDLITHEGVSSATRLCTMYNIPDHFAHL